MAVCALYRKKCTPSVSSCLDYIPYVSSLRVRNNDYVSVDVSHHAQLRDIDASFAAIESSELSALRHPIPPELTAAGCSISFRMRTSRRTRTISSGFRNRQEIGRHM